jgi:hypothetical protein
VRRSSRELLAALVAERGARVVHLDDHAVGVDRDLVVDERKVCRARGEPRSLTRRDPEELAGAPRYFCARHVDTAAVVGAVGGSRSARTRRTSLSSAKIAKPSVHACVCPRAKQRAQRA